MATTNPIPAYGGVALPPEVMYKLAAAIQEGRLPLRVNHDERHSLEMQILLVDVRETKTGSLGVWVEYEVDEQEWKTIATLQAIPPNLISSYIYEVLKNCFLKVKGTQEAEQEEESIFDFKIRDEGRCIDAQLKTSDPEIMKEALATFHDLVFSKPQGTGFEFDKKSKKWKKHR
jgi:hypothetical protein